MSVRSSIFLGRTSLNLIGGARRVANASLGLSLNRPNIVPLFRRQFARSYYFLTSQNHSHFTSALVGTTKCGCGMHSTGESADKDLASFLTEEIQSETKAQKSPKLPKIEGFEVTTDGAKVSLTRKHNNEKVTVTLNVNHTVDTDMSDADEGPTPDGKEEMSEMKSKPSFLVEIVKDNKTLAFSCNFVQDVGQDGPVETENYEDVFNIDELSIFEGDRSEATYAVSGVVMDGYLYDLLMSFLEERGISTEFADKLVQYCTAYEHKLYIGLLENIKTFVTK